MKILKRFVSFLFPSRCVECKREEFWICPDCLEKISRAKTPDHSWIISVWNYKDPRIKRLLWKFKFENKFSVIEDLSLRLYDELSSELSERAIFDNLGPVILVPIPLSKKSLRKRGYNQSHLIAEALSERSGGKLPVIDALRKIRETSTQHSINNRQKRLVNLRGIFDTSPSADIQGKNVIIVDDITTTHATLVEARRALKLAGAKKVLAYTIAH
jgi:competence protein ComFC